MGNDNENENKNEYENHTNYKINRLNDYFETIGKSKSFEYQIKLLKKVNYLNEYWHLRYYDDDKKLNLKIFKINFACVSNDIDEKLFEEVFGHTSATLADKLINTINNEENQIIINNIEKNTDKLYEQDDFNNFVIQPGNKRINIIDAVKLILKFDETIQLDGDWQNQKS